MSIQQLLYIKFLSLFFFVLYAFACVRLQSNYFEYDDNFFFLSYFFAIII
jgi:hypothetical protein